MTLAHVDVGQLVWVTSSYDKYLTLISHVDGKGRLFICRPTPDLIRNWRYGFDPLTGVSPNSCYKGTVLGYATYASIEEVYNQVVEEESVKNKAKLKAIADTKLRDAAPQLLEALRRAVQEAGKATRTYHRPGEGCTELVEETFYLPWAEYALEVMAKATV